jgi:hypothetical protein
LAFPALVVAFANRAPKLLYELVHVCSTLDTFPLFGLTIGTDALADITYWLLFATCDPVVFFALKGVRRAFLTFTVRLL